MNRGLLLPLMCVAGLLFAGSASADRSGRRASFSIAPTVSVRSERLTLADIAAFQPCDSEYAELVETLRKIDLGDAPAPLPRAAATRATSTMDAPRATDLLALR